jgi:thiol-disulfide isomerase/thioredoxin
MHTKKILLSPLLLLLAATAFAQTPAPAFKLKDAGGTEVALPSHQAGVDIYLFWATWCPYCKALMPYLQSIKQDYGDTVRVYALDIEDDGNPRAVMARHGYDFTLLPNADPVMPLYGVRATPGLFLVDARGDIRFNLYKHMTPTNGAAPAANRGRRAARLAPYWAKQIRRAIDSILAGPGTH